LALALLSSGLSLAARLFPPFEPPIFPNAMQRLCWLRRCRSVQCFLARPRGRDARGRNRAVNRALRKAYGIGICSVEEIGTFRIPVEKLPPQKVNGNGNNGNGSGPKVRDRLCQIIRQHKLDPELVKAYAVDFCGTKTLREASREQVENFVQQLADWAEKDRNALLCQLNSYSASEAGGGRMKRQVPGLAETARDSRPEIPDGSSSSASMVPSSAGTPTNRSTSSDSRSRTQTLAGQPIVGRLYCTQKAMWKLGWFLRDFLYDPELLAHEQVDEKALPGLRGVVKISHTVINGISLINLDGFAPASQWEELSTAPVSSASRSNPAEASR
jgi:hypothetical protein